MMLTNKWIMSCKAIILSFAAIQVMLSYFFFTRLGFYVFEVQSQIVIQTKSFTGSGGDEDDFIGLGVVLFSILAISFLVRIFKDFNRIDFFVLFLILSLQFFFAVGGGGDYWLTMKQTNGWILVCWVMNYFTLWVMFFVCLERKLRPESAQINGVR